MSKRILLVALSLSFGLLTVKCAPTTSGSAPNAKSDGNGSGGNNYKNNNPVQDMFRNFGNFLPPYANPLSYIPNQAFSGYGAQFATPFPFAGGNTQFPFVPQFGQQFNPGQQYGGFPPSVNPANGLGYAGPFTPSGNYGSPNPAYGNFGGNGGNVPVVSTRLNQPGHQAVYTNNDPNYASVSVQGGPGQEPQFRSKTVQGPNNSYGTAFAFSSG